MLLAACGGGNDAKEQKIEDYAAQHGVDADVELDAKGEVKSVTVNNGMGAMVGDNLDLPDGFPGDIHVSDNWSVMSTSRIPQSGFIVTAMTGASVEDTASEIREKMIANGWAVENEDQPNEMMTQMGFTKDNRVANFNLLNTGGRLNIQLSTMTRPR